MVSFVLNPKINNVGHPQAEFVLPHIRHMRCSNWPASDTAVKGKNSADEKNADHYCSKES